MLVQLLYQLSLRTIILYLYLCLDQLRFLLFAFTLVRSMLSASSVCRMKHPAYGKAKLNPQSHAFNVTKTSKYMKYTETNPVKSAIFCSFKETWKTKQQQQKKTKKERKLRLEHNITLIVKDRSEKNPWWTHYSSSMVVFNYGH